MKKHWWGNSQIFEKLGGEFHTQIKIHLYQLGGIFITEINTNLSEQINEHLGLHSHIK